MPVKFFKIHLFCALFSFLGCYVVFYSSPAFGAEMLTNGLSSPVGMAFGKDGALYISNWSGDSIAKWKNGRLTVHIDRVNTPTGLAVDDRGRLYVASYSSGKILRFDIEKNMEIFVEGLSVVAGISFDNKGDLLVAERGKSRILRITQDRKMTVLFDKGLRPPVGIVDIGNDQYIIADITGSIFLYDLKAKNLSLLTDKPSAPAIGLVFDAPNNVIYSPGYGEQGIYRIDLQDKSTSVIAKNIARPVVLVADKNRNLFVGSWSNNALYKITPWLVYSN